jgi:hypothetical protein
VILLLADSNPFTEQGVEQITRILFLFLNALNRHQVHPKVISQFFCYIFFFIGNSLFNAVMSYGKLQQQKYRFV